MDDILTLLESTLDSQEKDLNAYLKDYDNGFDQIKDISKQSLSESKMLKSKVEHDLKATWAKAK